MVAPDEPMPTLAEVYALPHLNIGGTTRQYDLENLLGDSFKERDNRKYHLFRHATKITITRSALVIKKQGDRYTNRKWVRELSVSVSTKINNDGRQGFNLYRHTRKHGLQNFTSGPDLVFTVLPQRVQALLLAASRELFEQAGGSWRVPTVTHTPGDQVLYNVYRAYFVDSATLKNRKNEFVKEMPAELMPLLRLPEPARLVEKLFGIDAPASLHVLAEGGLSQPLLMLGLLFGRLLPATVLATAGENITETYPKIIHLRDMRTLLKHCTTADREKLLQAMLRRPTALAPLDILLTTVRENRLFDSSTLSLKRLPDFATAPSWEALQNVFQAHVTACMTRALPARQHQIDMFLKTFAAHFEVGQEEDFGFIMAEDELRVNLPSLTGSKRQQVPMLTPTLEGDVMFAVTFFPRVALLPARHALHRRLGDVWRGHRADMGNPHAQRRLTIDQASDFVEKLATTLRDVATRHGIAPSREHITTMLLLYLAYYTAHSSFSRAGQRIKPPQVPADFYAYVTDTTHTLAQRRFGLRWDIPLVLLDTYLTLPVSYMVELETYTNISSAAVL